MLQPQIVESLEQTAQFIFVPANEDEYDRLVGMLDELIDIVRDDETHPLANWMDVLSVLVEAYEDQFVPEPDSDPIAVLKHFMQEYALRQQDLSELGSQGVVSEILNGKRELNLRQIRALSKRFNVSEAIFV